MVKEESIKKVKKSLERMNINIDKVIILTENEFKQIILREINYILLNDDFARKCFLKRLLNENTDNNKLKEEILKFFIYGSRIRYCNNSVEYRYWYMGKHLDVAYLNLAKCACTSIVGSFVDEEINDRPTYARENYQIIGKIPQNKTVFKFTYVRNPFERLVSCYVNKIEESIDGNYFAYNNYFMGILDKISGFEEFVKCITKIPERWADRHFKSMYTYIYDGGKRLVDYIGKVEELPDSYRKLQDKYNLSELKYENVSGKKDWKTYYTKETAKLVYKYYEKDIVTFGYEKQYEELLKYLN